MIQDIEEIAEAKVFCLRPPGKEDDHGITCENTGVTRRDGKAFVSFDVVNGAWPGVVYQREEDGQLMMAVGNDPDVDEHFPVERFIRL